MGQKASYFWLPCQSIDVLCLSVSSLWTDRNGTEKQIDIYGKSLMFMSRDLLFHFVEGPKDKCWTVLNSQRLWNSSERYWNGSGMFQEQKKRLLKLLETYMNDYLLNLVLLRWFSMTKMKPLYVDFCLETWDKRHHILASLSTQRCPLCFYIII